MVQSHLVENFRNDQSGKQKRRFALAVIIIKQGSSGDPSKRGPRALIIDVADRSLHHRADRRRRANRAKERRTERMVSRSGGEELD